MIRKITLLFLLCLGMHNIGMAQYSGFESAQHRLLSTDPAYAQRFQDMTNKWVNWSNVHPNIGALVVTNGNKAVFQVPVVVHVILPGSLAANPAGTTYDPTDAQINSMINYLNQTFSATYASYPDSNSGGTFIPIQFVLAKRDSNCNASTGIERIDGSSVANYVAGGVNNGSGTGANEISVKNLSRWPAQQYYNIYIVSKIDGKDGTNPSVAFTSGFAYMAPAPASVDGYVILATQVAPGNANIPLEMGHAFSLFNTFQGGTVTTCPVNNNCATDGDQICDTPPEEQSNFNCPTGTNPCTGLPYSADLGGSFVQHNFMDYSSCQDRFTAGQRKRMIFGLFTYRSGLLGSQGGVAPGVNPTAASCTPSSSNPGNTNDAGVYEFKIAETSYNPYIGGVTTYLDYNSGGYNSDGNKAYIDLTCKQQATVTAGLSYKFFVKAGPTTTGEKVAIYIDYNNDGAFSASELVYAHTGTVPNEVDSAVIAIPTPISYPGLVTCVPLRVRVISDPTNGSVNPCGPFVNGQAEDYNLIIKGSGSANGTVSISAPAQTDSTCIGTAITFTAQPSSGVDTTTATYKWFVNGVYTGNNGKIYTTSTIADGATVTAKLYFINQCGTIDSSVSNSKVVHRFAVLAPRVNIALTAGNNPGCPGLSMTFTATPFNGGSTVAYQWKVNGNPVGINSNTYTTSSLQANDTVTCVMYSSSSCAYPLSVVSNKIGILHYYLTAALSISATPNPSCAGRQVVLQATSQNQSANSQFQWYVNGTPVSGATGSTYVSSTFQNTDIIRCVMLSPSPCIINHSDTSNPIVISSSPTIIPVVKDSLLSGSNPGCLDSFITFSGFVTGYVIYNYQWMVNGVPIAGATNNTYSTDSLHNGDMVVLRATHTSLDNGCYSQDTVFTLPITVTLALTPDPPVISLIGNILVANSAATYQWYGPSGLIAGATGQTYTPAVTGYYYAKRVDTSCASASSNVVNVNTHVGVNNYSISDVKIYPNPTSGIVNMDWGTRTVNMKVVVYNAVGQGVMYDEVVNQHEKALNFTAMPSGNYFIVLRDEEGKVTTTTITLTR